jgi:putative transposase
LLNYLSHSRGALHNQRTDFLHKVSRKLVDTYDLIAYEDLKIKNMMQDNQYNLAKEIGDCSWGRFIAMIAYKQADNAGYAIAVNPRHTSQCCSICGVRNNISLSVRKFECVGCHSIFLRDHNASKNVLQLGLSCVPDVGTEAPAFRHGK